MGIFCLDLAANLCLGSGFIHHLWQLGKLCVYLLIDSTLRSTVDIAAQLAVDFIDFILIEGNGDLVFYQPICADGRNATPWFLILEGWYRQYIRWIG